MLMKWLETNYLRVCVYELTIIMHQQHDVLQTLFETK